MSDDPNLSRPVVKATVFNEVVSGLGLSSAPDPEYLFGEIKGSPVSMSVIGVRPLALLLAFRIRSDDSMMVDSVESESVRLPKGIAALVDCGKAKVSIEDEYAWLSFYDLGGRSAEEIRDLILSFAEAIEEAGFSLAPGCAKCAGQEDVELLFHEGRCSRLCRSCVAESLQEHQSAQAQTDRKFNSFGFRHALLLVPATIGMAVGWMVFFCIVDLLLRWLKTNVVVIPGGIGVLVLLAFFGACGWAFGYPLGRTLGRLPLALYLGPLAAVLACVVGEYFYITATIYLSARVFDPALAARILPEWVKNYAPSWILLKFLLCGAVIFGVYMGTKAAAVRKTVSLKL
jgi:hypothetical protein